MSAFRRPTPLLRALLVLLTLFCVVAKPALGLAGELHRDLHALAHAAAGDAAPALADEADEHAPAAGWHGVLHIDLCCGLAALPAHPLLLAPARSLDDAPDYLPEPAPPAPETDRLRPPIRT